VFSVVSVRRVVEILSSVGSEFTLSDLVEKLGISPRTAKKYITDMLRSGFITTLGDKYTVSERGLMLLEALRVKSTSTSPDSAYVFTDEKGSPVTLRIDSVAKLYAAVKYGLVPRSVVEHHLEKGYLAKWLSDVLNAKMLAKRVASVKSLEELVALLEEYLST
jgi:predicted transcriptional regulator